KNPADWKMRRKEILDRWHALMGEWPCLLKDQEMQILETSQRENFIQHRISLEWVPGQKTEGYLLVPDVEGPKPAVITVFYVPETAIGIGGKPYRDFAYQLVKRGFVTLSLGTTESTINKTYSIHYPTVENAEV